MDGNILKRLEDLEKRVCKDPIKVLCELNGEEVTLTVREALEKGAGFLKVVGGADLKDLDLLLEDLRNRAFEEGNK